MPRDELVSRDSGVDVPVTEDERRPRRPRRRDDRHGEGVDERHLPGLDRVDGRSVGSLDVDAVVELLRVGRIPVDSSRPRARVVERPADRVLVVEWLHRPVVGEAPAGEREHEENGDEDADTDAYVPNEELHRVTVNLCPSPRTGRSTPR